MRRRNAKNRAFDTIFLTGGIVSQSETLAFPLEVPLPNILFVKGSRCATLKPEGFSNLGEIACTGKAGTGDLKELRRFAFDSLNR